MNGLCYGYRKNLPWDARIHILPSHYIVTGIVRGFSIPFLIILLDSILQGDAQFTSQITLE